MKIGINLPHNAAQQGIREGITKLHAAGFEHIEINLSTAPLIVNGNIDRNWLEYLKGPLSEFPISFSAHIGSGINCRNTENYKLHKKALLSSITAAAELNMNPIVLHYEKKSDSEKIEKQFFDAHWEAALLAEKLGIMVCIENIEVEYIDPVIDFVKEIDHPNFKMTFDMGHAFLASKYFGFDFLESIKKALPVLRHLHLSDNSGTFEELRITDRMTYDGLNMGYRFAFGRGDIHLPPLWGNIPYKEIAEIVKDFKGIALCEFYSDYYKPFLGKIHSDIDKLFNKSGMEAL